MTKPHEDTWTTNANAEIRIDGGMLIAGYLRADCARLAAQAPAMARLLLKLEWAGEEGGNCPFCGRCEHGQQSFTSAVASLHYAIEYPPGTHATDCELVAVLRAAGVLSD